MRKWDLTWLSLHFHLLWRILCTAVWVRRTTWTIPFLLYQHPEDTVEELTDNLHRGIQWLPKTISPSVLIIVSPGAHILLQEKVLHQQLTKGPLAWKKRQSKYETKDSIENTDTWREIQRKRELTLFNIMASSLTVAICVAGLEMLLKQGMR